MKNKKVNIILIIIWLIVIFIMSSFNADTSSKQSGFIVGLISKLFNINNLDLLSLIVRKLAHFMEYFILGILVYNFIININIKLYYGIIFCLLYAISDEIHQIFVSGRVFQLRDVLIDFIGVICGMFLLYKLRIKFDNRE